MEQLQRTESWLKDRCGKFTASDIIKILGVKSLGELGKNYAIEKAIEEIDDDFEEDFISYDMQKGIDTEPFAFQKFKELKGLQFLEVEKCGFFTYENHAGASPDGLVSDNAVLEIKCPKSTTFFKLVATNEVDAKYYAQMQMQMLCTNREKAYFFNYLVNKGIEYHHEIIIKRDEIIIEKIKERLKEAIKIKLEYINLINKNKQWKY